MTDEYESKLVSAGTTEFNLVDFVEKAKELLDEMLSDYEESTGNDPEAVQEWTAWVEDLEACFLNS